MCAAEVFATYIHHLDPIIVEFGRFALRWYGLAYLAGFWGGYLLLKNLAKKGLWVLKPEQTGDFIAAAALFGVFLGGRLGYVLFYQLLDSPEKREYLLAHPWSALNVMEGGMSSHGGILGLIIFTWFYARRKKVTWTGLGDGLCVVAPIGLFLGRIANFINGELYGRIDRGISWAMKFPLAMQDHKAPESLHFNAALDAVSAKAPGVAEATANYREALATGEMIGPAQHAAFESLLKANREQPEVRAILDPYLEPRHPSQLYEALLEGLVLLAILWFVRVRFPKAPNGLLTALFFALYAFFRIIGEQFREPDAAMLGPVTKGQFLSFFMFFFAAAFFLHAYREWKKVNPVNPV